LCPPGRGSSSLLQGTIFLEKSVKTLYSNTMTIYLHQHDLPDDLAFGGSVAIDTETMGLNLTRDRLCLVQLSFGNGDAHLVQFPVGSDYSAPNLRRLLQDSSIPKLFHFARFDIASIKAYMGVTCTPVYCTKMASRLVRTFTDRHSLKELCKELLGVELSKQHQSSDWGQSVLTEEQKIYAANDVLYLHKLRDQLDVMLEREGRKDLAQACFDFLPARAELDLTGWPEIDIFAHNS
jgi:ribonuclease D